MKNFFLLAIFFLTSLLSGTIFSAPAINAHDIYGKAYHFSPRSEKWIIINYWATWCQFCVNEIPELNKLAKAVATRPAIFFAVNYDNAPDREQQAFATHYQMNYLLLHNNPYQERIANNQITTLPTTFIISPDGRVQQLEGQLHVDDVLGYLQ